MNIFQRLQDVLGLSEQFDQFDYVYDDEEDSSNYPAGPLNQTVPGHSALAPFGAALPSNVIEMPGMVPGQMEVVIMTPHSFESVSEAIAALRHRKAVILDLGSMEPDQAQRAVDYIAGGTFAIDGDQERLGEKTFLFTPAFVRISRHPAAKPPSRRTTPAVTEHPTPSAASPKPLS
jgi:cell division inhibitor SepF